MQVFEVDHVVEGDGITVQRAFPSATLSQIDPFLLLDHFGPVEFAPGKATGIPDHPHRGFEAVSYLLEGALQHRDSHGHSGRLGPGDMQWMTTGSGVVHSEMPDEEFRRSGGKLQGFQIWVNLPRADKMIAPAYQDIPASQIPVASSGGVTARVLAGTALGAEARIQTRTPVQIVHFQLAPGARAEHPIEPGQNAFAYVFRGTARLADHDVRPGQCAVFDAGAAGVVLQSAEGAELLFFAGRPLAEPVARYGPFVMNTPAEIQQAIADYRAGRLK